MSRISLHPTSLLLAWIALAVAISRFNLEIMFAASLIVALLILRSGPRRCWQLLRRTHILLITLLAVYAMMTPGTPVFPDWERGSPTLEGLHAGLHQAWRLGLMIGALAALLNYLSRPKLLTGIYGLLMPLKPLGVPVERFAVRLALTLQYVETMPKAISLNAHWDNALLPPQQQERSMVLQVQKFGALDAMFGLAFSAALGWALW